MSKRYKLKIQVGFWTAAICAVIAVGLYYFPKEFGDQGGFWKAFADGVDEIQVTDGELRIKLKE